MIDLSSDLRYPVDFGDGPDTPAANAERIDDDLWILTQRGQLRWVPIMQEWLQQLVVEDQQGGAAAGTTEPSNSFTQEESEGSEADSRSLVEQVEEQSGNLEAERLPVGENIQPPGDMEKNTSPARMSRTVKIGMYSNMHFSVGRFVAQTGERLTVEFENDDPQAQPHNLVFTKPGRRMKVFTDMMRMGPKAVGSGYIPTKSRSVLKEGDEVVAISLLNPGESGSVTFTAPDKVGAYPFACIYPGHQVSMYGVMHVVEDPAAVELPAEDADPGIPPGWIEANTAAKATEQKLQGTRRRLPF